jgi:hypothetical protein
VSLCQARIGLNITARQYGAFVLADAHPGTCPGTLARKLSRWARRVCCAPTSKARRGRVFLQSWYRSWLSITCIAVQSRFRASFLSPCRMAFLGTRAVSRYKVRSEPENCHGAAFKLLADARFAHRLRRP